MLPYLSLSDPVTNHFDPQLSQEEINSLISAYTSSDNAFANGFSIAGEKFVTIKADERSLYGKKVRAHLGSIMVSGVGC